MQVTFVTLFPESFESSLKCSILGRAIENKLVAVDYVNMRDFGIGNYNRVDDTPCGGGAGQVVRIDIAHKAIEAAKDKHPNLKNKLIIHANPASKLFKQQDAERYAKVDHLIFISGRYEGIDSRIVNFIDEERSIGDYVLSGGELACQVMFDATVRLLPGALGNEVSTVHESFQGDLLEHNQYTRPVEYKGHKVPDVYLSGDHKKIAEARLAEQKAKTQFIRPDLGWKD